ncbi:hypothetical protein JCM19232_6178 [Vibrio ishigakensis]|uniref:Glucosylceramidase n=1 Tax=Vibrio ishigakensis TaxID=1481914 RepID=A0A0B8PFM1_9VIBR|nr:hypothetical protein JCM19232_6178 [Vibrio ishigakensis]
MKNTIPYTSYAGNAQQLTTKGDAVEFIQPWYTPISTTPENTGMAVGGIGNTFSLTPTGSTPNFSFIPGIFVDISDEDIHLNDFYISIAEVPNLDSLGLKSEVEARNYLGYYPALFSGKTIDAHSNLLAEIKASLSNGRFYADNRESLIRWNIELSPRSLDAIVKDASSVQTQILVALDFFKGLLINTSAVARQLDAGGSSEIESVSARDIDYRALYPMAEYEYQGLGEVSLRRKVVSPLVKENAKLCSLPSHWNHFEVTNHGSEAKSITLVQPLLNLLGSTYRKGRDGIQDSFCTLTQNPINQVHSKVEYQVEDQAYLGISMGTNSPFEGDIAGEVSLGIAVDSKLIDSGRASVTIKPQIYSTNTETEVINALMTGRTDADFNRGIYSGREALSGLAAINIELEPGESFELRFLQTQDHSKIALGDWHSQKAYTQYFDDVQRTAQINKHLLARFETIEGALVDQQTEYQALANSQFEDENRAERFATMAMNTLSFLAESTVWDRENKFLVKECVDYPFFNSLDVYFYGSFSILYLLPEIDGCVMKDFAKAILAEDPTQRRYWEYEDKPFAELIDAKYQGTRAVRGAVIHDLGSPFDIQPDAYSWHNVKEWKDLAPKFILMVYRHYQKTGNREVVESCWDAILESLNYLESLIEPGDLLPLTRGTDDTFDNLSSHGISIYCASLWAAGLKAASSLAEFMGSADMAIELEAKSAAVVAEVEESLWDEEHGYYHFFVTPIQTKHLTGEGIEALNAMGIPATGSPIEDKNALNLYLNQRDDLSVDKLTERRAKKHALKQQAPQAFSIEFDAILDLDSDNSFGDAMLADSYLKLTSGSGLFKSERVQRSLEFTRQTNFLSNSPKVGVANMTLCDGMPHEAFQAQDVWIGVQFSVATALKLSDKPILAEELMDTTYQALYSLARIPFAAPEGFNASCTVNEELLSSMGVHADESKAWVEVLKEQSILLTDGRVNPEADLNMFELEHQQLQHHQVKVMELVAQTSLKYTAGRYFRPGMIFAYLY